MINIDDRILKDTTKDEFWLLIHITKRIRNSNEFCFPSIKTITEDTGLGLNKVRTLKKSLAKKGILKIEERYTKGGMRTSDKYSISSSLIKIMMGHIQINEMREIIEKQNKLIESLTDKLNVLGTHENREGCTHENREGCTHENREGKLLTSGTINKLTKDSVGLQPTTPKKTLPKTETCGFTYKDVLNYLNEIGGKKFKTTTDSYKKSINARINEGYVWDDFKKVIEVKWNHWKDDTKMKNFFQPSTLFTPTNFDKYLNQDFKKDKNQDAVKKLPPELQGKFKQVVEVIKSDNPIFEDSVFKVESFTKFINYYMNPKKRPQMTVKLRWVKFRNIFTELAADQYFSKKNGDLFEESFKRFDKMYSLRGHEI